MDSHNSLPENPLAPFARLVGGTWQMEDSYHTFEWGVGGKMVNTRSYFTVEGKRVLVSEGSWFWHPGRQEIKGHMAAIEMGIDLFSYTTRFEGNKMVSDLTSYGPDGQASHYQEEFTFTGENTYEWVLYAKKDGGLQQVMKGLFTRK
jgi:hypothetical protein